MKELRALLRTEARDTLIFTGSNLLNRLGAFLLLPLYWTKLTPGDYGILAVIAIIGAFQAPLSSLSLELALTRLYYEWPETERRRNVGAIWIWNWIITSVCALFLLTIFTVLGPLLFPDVPYRPWLLLGIVSNALSNLFIIPASTIRIRKLPWLFASYNVGSFLVSAALGLWLVLVRDWGLIGYITATITTNLLMAVVGGVVMLRLSRPTLWSPSLRETFRFALPALPSTLVSAGGAILDRFLLSIFGNLATLGVYAVALRFVEGISTLHASLKMSFGPFMMKEIAADRERGSERVAGMIPFYLLPYFAAAVGISLLIGPIVHLVGRPAYYPVIAWVPWLAGVQVLNCLYFYYANGMVLGNRTDLLAAPAVAQLLLIGVGGILLIPQYQLAGAVVSRYISAAVFLASSVYLSQRVFPLPHRWTLLAELTAASLLVGLLGALVQASSPLSQIAVRLPLVAVFIAASTWVVFRRVAGSVAVAPRT